MENKQCICPVCGAVIPDANSLSCPVCGCPGACYTLFSGESAYKMWLATIDRFRKDRLAHLYAASRAGGSSLHVTGDRLCFYNGPAHTAVMACFQDGQPTTMQHVAQVSLSGLHRVWVYDDGTPASSGDDGCGQRNLSDLQGVRAVATASNCTYAVLSDGSVVARGDSPFAEIVAQWRDIRALAATPLHIVGLRNDGTVVHAAAHNSPFRAYAAVMDGWKQVQAIATGDQYTLALHTDGTVSYAGAQDERAAAGSWTNMVAIAADGQYAVGLTREGDVLLAGKESVFIDFGRKAARQWKNMAFIAAGRSVIAGLGQDGEVKLVGNLFKADDFEDRFSTAVYESLTKTHNP